MDLQIQANHSTNHCIAFPMNGPMVCLKKLPCLDEKYRPQVTFYRLQDEWMKKAGKYKYLYKMDTEIAYDWLQFGSMQITQVFKIASLIPLTVFVMD